MSAVVTTTDEDAPGGSDWRRDRRPVIVAVVVVTVALGLCWLLRWWGPINPAVSAQSSPITATDSDQAVEIRLTNGSLAAVEVVSVELKLSAPQDAVLMPAEPKPGTTFPVVPGRGDAIVVVEPPRCPPGTSDMEGNYDGVVEARTSSGRIMSIPVQSSDSVGCRRSLPAPGTQPSDPEAPAKVIAAFAKVYGGTAGDLTRLEAIDDPRGVADATNAALAGPYGGIVQNARAEVAEITFDRPDHAWVAYSLTGSPLGSRKGEAVLVDGRWKVTRSTVCTDLASAMTPCPG